MNIDFNTDILSELLIQNSDKAKIILNDFPKINQWSKLEAKPTYLQLVSLSKYFHIPFGYFFLDKIPKKNYPIPHYRTVEKGNFQPSSELLYTIQTIEKRKEWASNILKEFKNPLPFADSISTKTDVNTAAQIIRNILKLPVDWANSEDLRSWKEAFFLLVKRTEDAGIFVVMNGFVGSTNLEVSEFRGFILYDKYAPFVFINGNDFVTGKIFTIIHEIVHVLVGKSASFDFANLEPADNITEDFCDKVTAEFLVPKQLILTAYERMGNDYNSIAHTFKVSRIVILRRLLDLGKISKTDFNAAYISFKISPTEQYQKNKDSKGNYYNSAPYKISREFFKLVYTSVKTNKTLYRDAFKLTGLSPKSFDGYVTKYFSKD